MPYHKISFHLPHMPAGHKFQLNLLLKGLDITFDNVTDLQEVCKASFRYDDVARVGHDNPSYHLSLKKDPCLIWVQKVKVHRSGSCCLQICFHMITFTSESA